MTINTFPLNTYPVNSIGVYATGSGNMASVEQQVGIIGSGNICSFEQDVQLNVVGSGLIVSIEQVIEAKASGQIIAFEQNVTELANNTFYQRNGYDVEIAIGGYLIPSNQIHGEINIERNVGESSSCTFTIIPSAGTQNPESFQGQSVYINVIKNGTSYRQFTGWVDLPNLDLIEKKITFNCTDRRINRINNLSSNIIKSVGSYSEYVFGQITDNYDELTKRLQTVSGDFDFDKEGNHALTSWTPKSTADFTLTNSDVYYDRPEVKYTNRRQTINTVTFTINYTHQRLHQQCLNYSWSGYSSLYNWFTNNKPSFPTKDMIEGAARQGAWKPINKISFTELWPAQGFNAGSSVVIWQPNQVQHDYQMRTTYVWEESSGTKIPVPIYDINGNKIYDVTKTTVTDTSSHLCRGASWRAGIKFAQNVTESYTVTMKSPQSITNHGATTETENIDIIDEYDTTEWEKSNGGLYNVNYNFYFDKKDNYGDLMNTMQVMLNKSRVSILKAHRDVIVSFSRSIWPQIDLKHTVELSTTPVDCKARVDRINHVINASTGEAKTYIDLRLSRLFNADANSSWSIQMPIAEDSSYIGSPSTITLGTHTGTDPASVSTSDTWTGYIGNSNVPLANNSNYVSHRTNFAEQFRVDYPAISDLLRKTRKLASSSTFNLSVPHDDLTIEY